MIVHFDPQTLQHNHVVYEPLPNEYEAFLETRKDWIRHSENLDITSFYIEAGDPPKVAMKTLNPAELEGTVIKGVPEGTVLLFEGEAHEVSGDVELEMESGVHSILLVNRKHYDKTIEVQA